MFPQQKETASPTTLWQADFQKSLLAKEIFTAINAPWPGAFFVFLEKEEMRFFDNIYKEGEKKYGKTHMAGFLLRKPLG